jgi:secreted trypsin-like serine protease
MLLLTNVACGGAPSEDTTTSSTDQSIQGGTADSGDPAVGLIWFQGGGFCTGTLISPTVVLTAGHCVQDPIDGFYTGSGKATANIGANPVSGMTKHAVSGMEGHPTYQAGGCPNPTLDLGLIHLAQPITNITPVKITSGAALPAAGATCTAIGFGTHTQSGRDTFEKKRSGTETYETSTTTAVEVTMGTALADHGDSGGPLVCGGVIIGATSCHNDGDYPQHKQEYYARVDKGLAWVQQKLTAWK